jgi:hypothetical protein
MAESKDLNRPNREVRLQGRDFVFGFIAEVQRSQRSLRPQPKQLTAERAEVAEKTIT